MKGKMMKPKPKGPMPPKGMHPMPGGHMMKDSQMKGMTGKPAPQKIAKRKR